MEKLHLLLLEDMISDAELVLRTLHKSGMNFSYILTNSEQTFISAIDNHKFDAILADNSLPQFTARDALAILKERHIDIPFILVTGSVSEDYAVMIIREGAYDYILKDRLTRLPNSIFSALEKFRLEQDRKKHMEEIIANEALLKEAARLARFGSWKLDCASNEMRWSDEKFYILGLDPVQEKPSIECFYKCVHPDDLDFVKKTVSETFGHLNHNKFYCRLRRPEGKIKHIYAEMAIKRDKENNPLFVNGFILDVSESKEAEIKEKKITEDLLQRNKDLEQFAYIVSHNLRSPVANIVGVSNALIEGDLDDHEQKDFMHALSSCVQKLDDIIIDLNHVLEIRDQVNENKEWVSFAGIMDNVRYSINSMVSKNQITVTSDFSEVDRMLTIKSYIHSIFYNLLSNSVKFRRDDVIPEISVKSYHTPGKVILVFKDNGIGIDLDKRRDQVFGLYKRFHIDRAEGKGMGLFMVKTQVEVLGGKISVESKVNEGTEFKIEFSIAEQVN